MKVKTVLKVASKYVMPVVAGIATIAGEIENAKLRDTVAELSKKVAKLEKKK